MYFYVFKLKKNIFYLRFMNKYLLTLAIILLIFPALVMNAQEKKVTTKFYGFVRNDMMYNTRQMTSARGENQFTLLPTPVVENEDGDDINAVGNLNMIGINSRLGVKIKGFDAFGATTSGKLEGDFFGTSGDTKFNFRLRHAFVKLDWGKYNLVVGQTWHGTFIPECFPGTITFGAGAPFNPLSRPAQVRLNLISGDLTLSAMLMGQGHFKSKGDPNSLKNSGMPEINLQAKFKKGSMIAGAGFDYQVLRPDITSEETVNSTSIFAYLKAKTDQLTFKFHGMLGQNNDNMVMIGGYAVSDIDAETGEFSYTPYKTLSAWTDIHTNNDTINYGCFIGYTENLGAVDDIKGAFTGRWANVQSMMKISPRVTYKSGNTTFGVEIEYFSVNYADPTEVDYIDEKGVIEDVEAANNIKFLLMLKYAF